LVRIAVCIKNITEIEEKARSDRALVLDEGHREQQFRAALDEDAHAIAVIVLLDDDVALFHAHEVEEFEKVVELFVGEFHKEGFALQFVPGFGAGAHGWMKIGVAVGRDD
jgi:hypothetical protein